MADHQKVFGAACLPVEDGHPGEAVGLRVEVVSPAVAEVLVAVEVVGVGRLTKYYYLNCGKSNKSN